MNKKFGLLGRTLKHSYSKKIHALLADYNYDLYEVEPSGLSNFVNGDLDGYNVTVPYKKDIIPYLDKVDKSAKEIGAVNTVVIKNGKKYGYNTDFLGMKYMLARAEITLKDKVVMILGSGGTSLTAKAVAKDLGAKEIVVVSRSGEINYQNCYDLDGVSVIINTTPVGTYPDNYSSPIDLTRFTSLSGVADVVYNPSMTMLTYTAKMLGIKYVNGFSMLVAQAKYASELFTGKKIPDTMIEELTEKLSKENQNIVLVGMAGSGKSTVGKAIAEKLNREFIDTDLEIEKREGKSIKEIFAENGEEYFREIERKVVKDICKLTGKVIATGGGVVINNENLFPLKSNGLTFWIKRDIDKLSRENRPLSKNLDAVKDLYEKRKDLYEKFADFAVDNNGDIDKTVKGIIEKL